MSIEDKTQRNRTKTKIAVISLILLLTGSLYWYLSANEAPAVKPVILSLPVKVPIRPARSSSPVEVPAVSKVVTVPPIEVRSPVVVRVDKTPEVKTPVRLSEPQIVAVSLKKVFPTVVKAPSSAVSVTKSALPTEIKPVVLPATAESASVIKRKTKNDEDVEIDFK